MIKTGLASVTFRKKTAKEVIDLVAAVGLEGIEWGGDIHVPHGELALAKDVGSMTREAGLATPSYGSYFRLAEQDVDEFVPIAETARTLGAQNIRVWTGRVGSDQADEAYRQRVVVDTKKIAEIAGDLGLTVSYEYHRNTVADTKESTLSLLRDVDRENVYTYWQVMPELSLESNLEALQTVLPYLSHFHVFQWLPKERLMLHEGLADWQQYMKAVQGTRREHWAFLEFVKDDRPEVFKKDAATLIGLVRESYGG